MFVIILLLACIAAVGFYRGWFHVSTGRKDNQPSATVTVDKDKIHKDEQKVKDEVSGFGQEAKEKIGGRPGKAKEPEPRP
jgi:hypothetical protein